MKVEEMKTYYVVLLDGTEVVGKSSGRRLFGGMTIYDACEVVRDDYNETSAAGLRRWLNWTEDKDSGIDISPQSIMTSFVCNERIHKWYEESLVAINSLSQDIQDQLNKIDEQNNLSGEDPSLDDFITEFLGDGKKGTIH